MNSAMIKRLGNAENKQRFVAEVAQILAPYGQVKRTQLLVEKDYPKTDVSCLVEMESAEQAVTAQNSLNLLLLGSRYLFFSVKISGDFIE
jgi:RNA recognition motif-containing protein